MGREVHAQTCKRSPEPFEIEPFEIEYFQPNFAAADEFSIRRNRKSDTRPTGEFDISTARPPHRRLRSTL